MIAQRAPVGPYLTSNLESLQSGTRVRQVIVSHKGREVAVFPRWGEIWLKGEKEPKVNTGQQKEWWDDFVLNVCALSSEWCRVTHRIFTKACRLHA